MGILNLFSKRQKKLRGEASDVFVYDDVPQTLRVQVVHIVADALGKDEYRENVREAYEFVHDSLAREYGVFSLVNAHQDKKGALFNFLLKVPEYEKALDVIELCFQLIDRVVRDYNYQNYATDIKTTPDDAIAELNSRFLEAGVGYRFESGELIRVDSEFLHSEAVKPALDLLRDKEYKGANSEFLKGHEHYRHGRYEETLTECLKAFESTLKVICHRNRWTYSQNDTAKKLLDICFSAGLIPDYLQSEFTALRATLESGTPVTRNKQGGHGQGVVLRQVPQHLAGYVLNLTASSIVFLIEADKTR